MRRLLAGEHIIWRPRARWPLQNEKKTSNRYDMRVYRKVRYVELHTQQARYDTYIYVLNFIYCATSREKSAHWNSGMGIAGRCRLFQINPQKLGVPS